MTDLISTQQVDPAEQNEWLEALESVIDRGGVEAGFQLLNELNKKAHSLGIETPYKGANYTYTNTITLEDEPNYPGDIEVESKIEAAIRWNAAVMVAKANKKDDSLGGHISSGAGAMTLYEVGFNHCFKAPSDSEAGDLIFYQGHSSPIIYARSFIEGRLSEEQLTYFRQQSRGQNGLASYPHPYLHPEYWQFPTVSMGLGPLQAIYQARFMKYLHHRELTNTNGRHVWAFLGDGEMDEPESLGALTRAAREKLNNLTFVISCNLQRLDGLVNGNGKIIEELAGIFQGSGWQVIKVLWGSNWQPLFDKDISGKLQQRLAELNDGQLQNCTAHGGSAIRETIFGGDSDLEALASDLSDEDLEKLMRGGHDPKKVYAAYHKALNATDKPTVVLAHTVKGYGLGEFGESKNIAHNVKKLNVDGLKHLRDRFGIDLSDKQVENYEFLKLDKSDTSIKYMKNQRQKLGGFMPNRVEPKTTLKIPHYTDFAKLFMDSSGDRELSTTTAFVRMLVAFTKNKELGKYVVPIVPDESRTFGMEGLFRQLGIYNINGQQYTPEDKKQVMYYKESQNGQILQEGINEAGAFCSWLAAATAYSVHRVPTIPFYIYYSMFGFQRIGDIAWAAGDSMAKGFLLGGTAGRTTLNGEGLQHQDGHTHIQAGIIPNCVTYDPTYAYELAVILWDGLRRMYQNNEHVFYYITVMNENYPHGAMPKDSEEGIIKGLYLLRENKKPNKAHVQLTGSGTILREVEAASELLEKDFGITSDIWSMTSANELYRQAMTVKRENLLNPEKKPKVSHIEKCFSSRKGPVIASTDYVKLYTEQLREFVPSRYVTLGTDGFGRSDSRQNLRHFFEVDRYYVAYAAVKALVDDGVLPASKAKEAMKKYKIDPKKPEPMYV
ncbi:pyruvate dehydrogenase (acetyl-transferring), homodimeric type [Thiotrichales bacterium 19S9-12]|nr:pyruvate dehydrogenase (acetyl-transferring), homodimeric type [Thiotrichales bacterium 19S9-11]MCF6811845.1 pyruvate dehydrogenase (acetyl-transferring), homodimeric type [Thiotrichales bacterium 19S9-12]